MLQKQLIQWISGIGLYSTINLIIDYPTYGIAIWAFGPIKGGVLMGMATFIIDIFSIKFYDWTETDWLAIELLKYKLNKCLIVASKYTVIKRCTTLIMLVTIVVMSLKFNPFIVTIVMRQGAFAYNGLSRRDWMIFIFSFLIGQIYWIVLITTGVKLIMWHDLFNIFDHSLFAQQIFRGIGR